MATRAYDSTAEGLAFDTAINCFEIRNPAGSGKLLSASTSSLKSDSPSGCSSATPALRRLAARPPQWPCTRLIPTMPTQSC